MDIMGEDWITGVLQSADTDNLITANEMLGGIYEIRAL